MPRVGKKPIPVPAGVTANVPGQTVLLKGSKLGRASGGDRL